MPDIEQFIALVREAHSLRYRPTTYEESCRLWYLDKDIGIWLAEHDAAERELESMPPTAEQLSALAEKLPAPEGWE